MEPHLTDSGLNRLFDALARLKTRGEFHAFFDDLCTIAELEALSQRFAVARLLSEGKTYNEAASATGASSATISRVNKCLLHGAGGYKTALERLGKDGV
ncbi:MAG: hypothetical protein LBP26_08015 [Clostridiales bacterium]|jgi:TrpR-related protein YerC/YecD|nr:hypothetical protein [Clostridiales bacterium]